MRSIGAFAAIAVALSAAAACVATPDAGTRLARELSALGDPLVASVTYDADNGGSGPVLNVVLRPEATRDDARQFGCAIVVPAVARVADELPDDFTWNILDSTTQYPWSSDAIPCPLPT